MVSALKITSMTDHSMNEKAVLITEIAFLKSFFVRLSSETAESLKFRFKSLVNTAMIVLITAHSKKVGELPCQRPERINTIMIFR